MIFLHLLLFKLCFLNRIYLLNSFDLQVSLSTMLGTIFTLATVSHSKLSVHWIHVRLFISWSNATVAGIMQWHVETE